jgi:RNA polymerase sigma-70 factor, ECF subfamily
MQRDHDSATLTPPASPILDDDSSSSLVGDDAQLLRAACADNDRDALSQLYSRHHEAAHAVARRMLKHSADAEDAVQSAFVELLANGATYRHQATVRAYILGIVVNVCRMQRRAETRLQQRQHWAASGSHPIIEQKEIVDDERDIVRRALATLPERYRLPLFLRFTESMCFRDIADVLGTSSKTVESQVSRGLLLLRQSLTDAGYTIPPGGIPNP